jgi:tRNA (cmo5U34)-methyltransferase
LTEYRWNAADAAAGYDQAAAHIHPHYLAIQDVILDALQVAKIDGGMIVDLGGGSGRLAERIAERFPQAQVIVVDQSEPFLAIAGRRLEKFGAHAKCIVARLQDRWEDQLLGRPAALVSMSAIHHLIPDEKRDLYRRCHDVLVPGGILLNGDEVRPDDDAEYRRQLDCWWQHMQRVIDARLVLPEMAKILEAWKVRNIDHFDQPRRSGDDCQETTAIQLQYLLDAGFATADIPWQRELWAVLRAVKQNQH